MKANARNTFLALAVAALGSTSAQAAWLDGDTVKVWYDDTLSTAFGVPSIAGDVVFFTPTQFKALSLDGLASDLESATFNLRFYAKDGYQFTGFDAREEGDYWLLGDGSSVKVAGQVRGFDLNAPAANSASAWAVSPLATRDTDSTQNWTANASLSFSGVAYSLSVQNLLLARSKFDGDVAFVEKKFVAIDAQTSMVPEADQWALMLAGIGMIGAVARRRLQAR